jgi:enoyl-CoA hydratase
MDAGIGTDDFPSDRLDALEGALASAYISDEPFGVVDAVVGRFTSDPGPAPIARLRARNDACFGRQRLSAVLTALEGEASGWGATQAEELASKSPTSLAVTFRQLCKGATLDF